MPENIRCSDCGQVVWGSPVLGPKPFGRDDCHNCGGIEFERIE